jgi:hypothetical protein
MNQQSPGFQRGPVRDPLQGVKFASFEVWKMVWYGTHRQQRYDAFGLGFGLDLGSVYMDIKKVQKLVQ